FKYRSERHNMARKAYEMVVCLQHRRVHVTQRDLSHVGKIMLRKELNERQTVQESIHLGIRDRRENIGSLHTGDHRARAYIVGIVAGLKQAGRWRGARDL